jgi:menaquinone-dependent protoporphyrinogen oxidase
VTQGTQQRTGSGHNGGQQEGKSMSTSVLIAYATRAGSTCEVAEAISATFREAGLWPELLPMSKVDSFQGAAAVILGAPLYMGRFPREFRKFAVRHRGALANLRPWFFALGPTRNQPEDFKAARRQAEKQLARYPWIQPAELHVFGGRWDATRLPFPFTLLRRVPASDIRDWSSIREWSLSVAHTIKPAA